MLRKFVSQFSKHNEMIIGSIFFALVFFVDNTHSIGLFGQWKYGTLDMMTGSIVGAIVLLAMGKENFEKNRWIVVGGNILFALTGIAWCVCFFRGYPYINYCYVMMNLLSIGTALVCVLNNLFRDKKKLVLKADWMVISFMIFSLFAIFSRNSSLVLILFVFAFLLVYLLAVVFVKRNELIEYMENGLIVAFWVSQMFAWAFRPYDEPRYNGFYYNVQNYSGMCLIVFIFAFLKAYRLSQSEKTKKIKKMLLWTNCLAIGTFLFMSISRIAIAIGFFVVFCILLCLIVERKIHIKAMSLLKTFVLSVCVFLAIFFSVRFFPTILAYPIWFGDEYYKENIVLRSDSADSEKYVELDEFLEAVLGRGIRLFSDNSKKKESDYIQEPSEEWSELSVENSLEEESVQNSSESNVNASKYFLGKSYNAIELRIAIWRTYLAEVNFWGHGNDEMGLQVGEEVLIFHPHNIFVYMLYAYGIPSGIAFFIWALLVLKRSIAMVKKKEEEHRFLPLAVFSLVMGFGMADSSWEIGTLMWFAFMFIQIFLLKHEEKG